MEIEPHAFGDFVPTDAETLIIGTFPSHSRNRDFEFFYPNPNNSFWKIIGSVFSHTFQFDKGEDAVSERKRVATLNKFGLTDMLSKAIRKDDNSGDDQLINIELMDIFLILKSNPDIKRIILTSRSGDINALLLFEKYMIDNKIQLYKSKTQSIITGFFEFENRKIKIFVPYSPSPRVIRRYGFEYIKNMFQDSFNG